MPAPMSKKMTTILSVMFSLSAIALEQRDYKAASLIRERPADFDSYWDGEIARQRSKVPFGSNSVKRVSCGHLGGSDCWDVTVPALAERPVRGWLSVPRDVKKGSLPIFVRFDGHTTTSALKVAYSRAIVFSVNPCGCENEGDERYYSDFFGKWDYMLQGWQSRDACWFHGQVLRAVRALEWVKTLPEWNGKDLIVFGRSMGGSQAVQAAALDPSVSVCAAVDPALCDHAGCLDKAHPRNAGWPSVYEYARTGNLSTDVAHALATSDYYETCFFADRIRCRTFIASGLKDGTCPTEGVYLAYRNVKGPKEFTVGAEAGHCNTANAPYEAYRDALLASVVPVLKFADDADYLKRKFRENVADMATGMDVATLQDGIERIEIEWKDKEDWAVVKARMFAYVCDNMAIGCSGHDWFPAFAAWNRNNRPLSLAIERRSNEVDRNLLPKVRAAIDAGWTGGRFSMWRDFDHSVPDWDEVLALGWPGIERRLDENAKDEPFYRALRMTLDASKRMIARLTAKARDEAGRAAEGSVARRRLEAQAEALANILVSPPKTSYEMMMFQYLYFYLGEHVDAMQVRSLGNFDRLLTPYCRADLAAGRTTMSELREQLRHYWWQWGSIDNYWCQPVWVGGTKADGSTEFNEVSELVLDVHDELALPTPKMLVKISEKTPQKYLDQMLDMARRHRSISFNSEETMTKILKGWRNCSDEECRTCELNGCYEFYVKGVQNITQSSHVSYVQPVSDLLSRATSGAFAAETFEAFRDAYVAELLKNACECLDLTDAWEKTLTMINPGNFYSLTCDSSVRSGKDAFCLGLKYNDTALLSVGLGTAVDALLAVKELVYEKNELSLVELGGIMARDWKGHEALQRRMLRSKRKWGNNDREANALGKEISRRLADIVNGRPNSRGGVWGFSGHSAKQFVILAKHTGATPDGRNAGQEVSKNLSPAMGADTEGLTALVNTYAGLDPVDFPVNFPLDVMLLPMTAAGDGGLRCMRTLLRHYFANGGTTIQFNVFGVDELKDAQTHPEKYENLQVRVCGWNVRWNDIPKSEQDEYIRRAECIVQ